MLTQSNLQQFGLNVSTYLRQLLVDDLGQYSVAGVNIPSLWVMPPDLPQTHKILIGSGVECLLNLEPVTLKRDTRSTNLMQLEITLTQYNIKKTITPALNKIYGDRNFTIHEQPVITPARELGGELYYARAKTRLTVTNVLF